MNSKANACRIVVRGAGEMASGVIHCLRTAGHEVIVLEKETPECVRRTVCFAEVVYERQMTVENITAVLIESPEELPQILSQGRVPILVDPDCKQLSVLKPSVLIDARMLKRVDDCSVEMAPIVIGLGPGFTARQNCHAVIETNRGEALGAVILGGSAQPDTGIPSPVRGVTSERVLRAPCDGILDSKRTIGEVVKMGESIASVSGDHVRAAISGLLRGLIRGGSLVKNGQKIGDIDPEGDNQSFFSISDKARAIGRGTLEALNALQSDRV